MADEQAKNEKDEKEQMSLFDVDPEWKAMWEGMPEFVQKDLQPVKQLIVSFETEADVKAFAELVGQTITMNTRSIWYPEAEIGHFADRKYVDDGK